MGVVVRRSLALAAEGAGEVEVERASLSRRDKSNRGTAWVSCDAHESSAAMGAHSFGIYCGSIWHGASSRQASLAAA